MTEKHAHYAKTENHSDNKPCTASSVSVILQLKGCLPVYGPGRTLKMKITGFRIAYSQN